MNSREKILALFAFSATGILLVAFIAMRMFITPTTEYREQAKQAALNIDKLENRNSMQARYASALTKAAKTSYGADASTASEMSRAHIVRLVAKAGLAPDELSLTPVTGKMIRGGREVGWIIRIKGSLERLTNLLFVFDNDPHLHKLDNINWSPIAASTDLTLQARFTTLVLEPVEGVTPEEIKPESLMNEVKLTSTQRKSYALISDRDIFRPYIKKPPPPYVPPKPATIVKKPDDNTPAPPPTTPSTTYQLVGLPTWNNVAEVVVRDSRSGKSTTYKLGENWLGGELVMVDYRSLPLPKNPLVMSNSRAIVRVGRDSFWAVELGQLVTDKYLLTGDRLPAALRDMIAPAATEQPAASPVESGTQKPEGVKPDGVKSEAASGDATKNEAIKNEVLDKAGSSELESTTTVAAPVSGCGPVVQEAGHAP